MRNLARILAAVLAAVALQAHAQGYPARPVRAIIAFPPGSATDIIGRVIAAKVSDIWGQQVVADNRGGAGGSIASAIAAKSAPDGYTVFINSNAHVVNPSMYAKLPYDTLKDFTDIMPLVSQPNVLVVNAGSRFRTLADFLAEDLEAKRDGPGLHGDDCAGGHPGHRRNQVCIENALKRCRVKGTGSVENGGFILRFTQSVQRLANQTRRSFYHMYMLFINLNLRFTSILK